MKKILLSLTFLLTLSLASEAQHFDSYIGFGGNDSIRVLTSDNFQRVGWDEVASGEKTNK